MSGHLRDRLGFPRLGWLLAPLAGIALVGGCMGGGGSNQSVRYRCDGGRQVTVVFMGNFARVFDGGGPPVVLDRRRARNGFWFESATHSIRGSGRTMTYTVGRMVPMHCRKIGSGRW